MASNNIITYLGVTLFKQKFTIISSNKNYSEDISRITTILRKKEIIGKNVEFNDAMEMLKFDYDDLVHLHYFNGHLTEIIIGYNITDYSGTKLKKLINNNFGIDSNVNKENDKNLSKLLALLRIHRKPKIFSFIPQIDTDERYFSQIIPPLNIIHTPIDKTEDSINETSKSNFSENIKKDSPLRENILISSGDLEKFFPSPRPGSENNSNAEEYKSETKQIIGHSIQRDVPVKIERPNSVINFNSQSSKNLNVDPIITEIPKKTDEPRINLVSSINIEPSIIVTSVYPVKDNSSANSLSVHSENVPINKNQEDKESQKFKKVRPTKLDKKKIQSKKITKLPQKARPKIEKKPEMPPSKTCSKGNSLLKKTLSNASPNKGKEKVSFQKEEFSKGGEKLLDKSELDETVCSICLEDLSSGTIHKLTCDHEYHYDCIIQIESPYCPICRKEITNLSEEKLKLIKEKEKVNKETHREDATTEFLGNYISFLRNTRVPIFPLRSSQGTGPQIDFPLFTSGNEIFIIPMHENLF